jgi:hypothetical protein
VPEGANVRLSLDVDGWQPLIDKAMDLASKVVVEVTDSDLLEDDSIEEVTLNGQTSERRGLKRLKMPLCAPFAVRAVTKPSSAGLKAFDDYMEDFAALLSRAKQEVLPTPLNSGLPSPAVVTGGEGASLLRLMLAHNGLTTVIRKNLHRIRRAYLEVTESEPLIRGRITQRGLVTLASRNSLQIECTHDEFSELTPLFRLLMTALDRVAQQRFTLAEARIFPQRGAEQAASLRSQLLAIPSLSLQEASVLAPRMQLRGRLRAEWQEALELARIVLAPEQATQFDVRRLRESGAALQVVTSTFWEQKVVRGAFEGFADKKRDAGEVWAAANPKQPDCVVRVAVKGPSETDSAGATNIEAFKTWMREFFNSKATGNDTFEAAIRTFFDAPSDRSASGIQLAAVLDAKYAEAKGDVANPLSLSAPGSGYQYQMLAYSLLVENCVAAVLIHPCLGGAARKSVSFRRKVPMLSQDSPQMPCTLSVVEHPFPTAKQCEGGWKDYLDTLREAVQQAQLSAHGASATEKPQAAGTTSLSVRWVASLESVAATGVVTGEAGAAR